MKTKYVYITVLIIGFLFNGCTGNPSEVQKIFQTDDTAHIQSDYHKSIKLILEYKKKLDKKNPNGYNKRFSYHLIENIQSSRDHIILHTSKGKVLKHYVEYFNYAFDTTNYVQYRNDYLIIGMYKLIHSIYMMEKQHKFISYEYDVDRLKNGYRNLQTLHWKISYNKYPNGNYIFNTWQKEWQIELLKQYNIKKLLDYRQIQKLPTIENSKESIFNPSDCTFSKLLNKIIYNVENSIGIIDLTPEELTKEVLSSAMFIL